MPHRSGTAIKEPGSQAHAPGAPKAEADDAPNTLAPPNAGAALDWAPNSDGADWGAPKAGADVTPKPLKEGALCWAPKAGVEAAPKAGVDDAPNGEAADWAPKPKPVVVPVPNAEPAAPKAAGWARAAEGGGEYSTARSRVSAK